MARSALTLLEQARIAAATVAHLKPIQIADRLRRRVAPARRPVSAGAVVFRAPGLASPPARRGDGGFDGRSFGFLNRRHPFEGSDRWRADGAQKLWAYHLHYFDWVHGLDDRSALELMIDWIRRVDFPQGPGWDPYPISMRVREWCEWLADRWDGLPQPERESLIESLAVQAQVLRRSVELHLQGNHLLENAIALCWVGLRLAGPAVGGVLDHGRRLLEHELVAQILSDGVHEERSPSYQARICEGLLRLAEVGEAVGTPEGLAIARVAGGAGRRMLAALHRLSHPDGDVALLNDSGIGWAPTAAELGTRFGLEEEGEQTCDPWLLESAGFAGLVGRGLYLVFDGGPIGPDHQPGHGHADTLTFELSVGGTRLVADTGVLTYEPGVERLYDRGTAAHSTVQLDDRDQCELWAAFRCGRRPRVARVTARRTQPGRAVISGGYRAPLGRFGSYRHAREVVAEEGKLSFRDTVEAQGGHRATLRVHLAPDVEVERAGGDDRIFRLLIDGRAVARVAGEAPWRPVRAPYHPGFNIEKERWCLEAGAPFQESFTTEWSIDVLGPVDR